jgi:hypothetical protein
MAGLMGTWTAGSRGWWPPERGPGRRFGTHNVPCPGQCRCCFPEGTPRPGRPNTDAAARPANVAAVGEHAGGRGRRTDEPGRRGRVQAGRGQQDLRCREAPHWETFQIKLRLRRAIRDGCARLPRPPETGHTIISQASPEAGPGPGSLTWVFTYPRGEPATHVVQPAAGRAAPAPAHWAANPSRPGYYGRPARRLSRHAANSGYFGTLTGL